MNTQRIGRFSMVTETYPPEVNGVALTVQALEQGLLAHGHEVMLIRPRQPAELAGPAHHVQVTGVPLPRYPGQQFGLPAGRLLRARWTRQRPDAVYIATEGPLGVSALRTARRLGIPVATGFHTRFDEYVSRYGLGLLRAPVLAWMRRFHNAGNGCLVPTEALRTLLLQQGFRNPIVHRRGVDTALFHPGRRSMTERAVLGVDEAALLVIHVGRIAPEKNLELAVRSFRAIQQAQPTARCLWVGDGPARPRLQAANPDFLFTGVLRGEALARTFASADLFLFPSLTETYGNVTLEAMACGVPTVAYRYGAAGEHLHDGTLGAAVRCHDAEAFVRAAVTLAGDVDARRRYATQAAQAMAALCPMRVADDFAQILFALG